MKRSILAILPIATAITALAAAVVTTKYGSWQVVSPENVCTARIETSAIALDDLFYLIGGIGMLPVEVFDPKSNLWTTKASPPLALHHFAAVLVDKKFAVFGALTGGFPKEQPVPNLWWYDPAADTWTKGQEIPEDRRRGAAGCVLDGDKLYIVGGNTNGHWNGFVPWLDSLDLISGEWKRLPDAPNARDHFQAGLVEGKIYAAGGRHSHAEIQKVFDKTVSQVDVYDIGSGKWTTLPDMIPTPRAGAPTLVRDGRVILIGGESGMTTSAHAEVEALITATGKWETLPPLNVPRHSGGAAFINDELYYVAGNASRGGGNRKNTIEKLSWPLADSK